MARVIVVDTNIWVSAFLTPRGYPARLKAYWQASRFDVAISTPLLAELAEVLARPRLQNKYRYSTDELTAYLRLIATLATLVPVTGELSLCRDPDDDILLETAIVGKAAQVVSRDEDITRDTDLFGHLEKYRITTVTLNRFLKEVKEERQ